MNLLEIGVSSCCSVVALGLFNFIGRLIKKHHKSLLEELPFFLSFVLLLVLIWGEHHDWSFALRYCVLCVSMFPLMIAFGIKKGPPTRWDILLNVALPLFWLILGAMDVKLRWALTIAHY